MKKAVMERNDAMRLERIEGIRESMSARKQADFIKNAYLTFSEDDKSCCFSLFYQVFQRVNKQAAT